MIWACQRCFLQRLGTASLHVWSSRLSHSCSSFNHQCRLEYSGDLSTRCFHKLTLLHVTFCSCVTLPTLMTNLCISSSFSELQLHSHPAAQPPASLPPGKIPPWSSTSHSYVTPPKPQLPNIVSPTTPSTEPPTWAWAFLHYPLTWAIEINSF